MYAVGRLGSYISRGVYTVSGPFHPFGGAVDIIVVEQQDGSFKSSPWYVKFGKFQGVLKRKEKVVNICVNEVEADFHMYLDHKGEAYFLRDVDVEEDESVLYPSSSGEETDGQSSDRTPPLKSKSCDYDANKSNSVTEIDVSNGKIVARTSSRRSRILGLVFGRKSMKDRLGVEEDSSGVGRADSLARAEIAADLLDVKWSTNLASGRHKKDNTPVISVPDISNGGEVQDLQINDQQRQANSVANSNMENSLDHHVSHEEIISLDHEMSSSSQPGSQELESSVEEASTELSCLITDRVIGTLTSTGSGLGENDEINSEMSEMVNALGVRNADHDEDGKGVTSEITIPNSEIVELEAYTSKKVDENLELDKNVVLRCSVVSEGENGADGLQSFVHCESSESSKVGLDGSGKQSGEIMYLSCGGSGEVYVHAETLHETTELKSMVNTSPETGLLSAKESLDFQELLGDKNCCNVLNDAKILESEGTSTSSSSIANGYVTDTYSQMVTVSSINVSVKEVESQSFSSVSGFCNPICQVKDEKNVRDEDNSLQHPSEPVGVPQEFSDHVPTKAVNDSAPEGSEEEQFVFSDIDDFQLSGVKCMNFNSADQEEKENPSLTPENTEAVIESFDSNFELCSSPDMFVQENPPNGDEDLRQKSRILSSSINIPGSSKVPNVEVGRMAESLPDMWLNVDDLDAHGLHHSLGHSLDSNYKSSKWMLLQEEFSNFVNSEAYREHQFSLAQPTTDEDKILEELKDVPANPAELCSSPDMFVQENPPNGDEDLRQKSRILSSRINITGSSKVPNDEVGRMVESLPDMWLNVDDLDAHDLRHSLGNSLDSNYKSSKWMLLRKEFPKFVKSEADREHQFPLAQPSTDNDQTLEELKDVPAPATGDTSKAIDASGGSWRLWPFPFKRSRSMKATQSAINSTRSTDAKITFESAIDMDGEKSVLELKVNKKKVRAITPTSEQLASLNLKEGRNTVTFTFSTAMLGNQQVDARIYLWRWDTRIVISDVDGTITKSDVLGQFMPMFGMDWSQTGVAHLFSAIKENGYQLLFLSARAISQAYHTRQFLFNLKQNGKALPDGPIVISPDGLFPSLFREVIRRAPHEFKIACLEDIKALFPPDCSPFYAGFGNRDTDEFSYLKVGIPKGKIFIINPKGQVVVNRRVDTKSYTSLHDLVHGMFPPMSSSEQEDFNSWNFWKLPVPAIDV